MCTWRLWLVTVLHSAALEQFRMLEISKLVHLTLFHLDLKLPVSQGFDATIMGMKSGSDFGLQTGGQRGQREETGTFTTGITSLPLYENGQLLRFCWSSPASSSLWCLIRMSTASSSIHARCSSPALPIFARSPCPTSAAMSAPDWMFGMFPAASQLKIRSTGSGKRKQPHARARDDAAGDCVDLIPACCLLPAGAA